MEVGVVETWQHSAARQIVNDCRRASHIQDRVIRSNRYDPIPPDRDRVRVSVSIEQLSVYKHQIGNSLSVTVSTPDNAD
jgi:hypothetical protein